MPCNTITTQSVVLAKAMPDLVAEAMKSCGWRVDSQTKTVIQATGEDYSFITWTAGQGVTVQGYNNQQQISKLTKAYSKTAVSWAAQRAGWTVQSTGDNTLTVTRR